MQKYLYKDLYELEDTHWWHKSKRANIVNLLQKFLTIKNPKILDIGCGTGKNIEVFSKIGPTFGVDKSPEAIAYCRKRGLKTVTLGSVESTGLKSNFFDVITLLDVLEHTDDNETLKEIYRILRPGGLLIITVPAFKFLWSKWDKVLQHKRRYSKKSLEKLLQSYQFAVEKMSYMFSFLFIPVYLVRLIKSRPSKDRYSSDFQINTPLLNYALLALARLEHFFIRYTTIPIGTSIVCIARKL